MCVWRYLSEHSLNILNIPNIPTNKLNYDTGDYLLLHAAFCAEIRTLISTYLHIYISTLVTELMLDLSFISTSMRSKV